MLDDLNYNNVLNVIEYLNVIDSGMFAATSRRHLYLVSEYRRLRGPEVAAASSWDGDGRQRSARDVASAPMRRMQKPPNLVLAFNGHECWSELGDELSKVLPPDAVVLGACARSIQVNLGTKDGGAAVESSSKASVMFASFPNADIRPFSFNGSFFGHHGRDPHYERDPEEVRRGFEAYAEELSLESERHWRSIIVYAAGRSGARFVDSFVSVMQTRLPNVAIVGGICDGGYVTRNVLSRSNLLRSTVRRLRMIIHNLGGNGRQMSAAVEKTDLVDLALRLQAQHSRAGMDWVEDGIFGAVLGGDVPVRSIVSRGVRSITHDVPQPSSPYVVKTAELIPKQEGWHSESVHLIRDFLHKGTGRTIDAAEILTRATVEPEFIGVRRPHEDGFELHMLGQGALVVPTDGSPAQEGSLVGAEVDFFYLDGEACCRDVDRTVSMLREQTRGEEILGAVMFSCSGRGPRRGGLIGEDMADATRFANAFPDVPCLGYYAGGEIGPTALAGNRNVFRQGKATVQGFTAVFCLFIVPVVERRDYELDDSPDAVRAFVDEWLSRR
jgi:small ligand-binding sensory domain FIST